MEPSTGTSRSLLLRVQGNEPGGWDQLVTLYGPLVVHWCRRGRLQEEDIADVFQEVFQAVLKNIAGFRKERASDTFRGWLRTVTRNKVHDHFRKAAREPRGAGGTEAQVQFSQLPAPDPVDEEEEGAAEAKAEHALYCRALDLIHSEFKESTWRAFWRTAVDGQSARDVADELSISAGAVRVARSRVLHRLREELGDLLD